MSSVVAPRLSRAGERGFAMSTSPSGVINHERPEFLPLKGLANILTGLMAAVVTVIAARLTVQQFSLGSAHWRDYFIGSVLNTTADITIAGLSILFVGWFYRARIDAELQDFPQRRARAWAFWGWIVPIVDLWFPFQIMGDIWRAGLPALERAKTAWLPALWWACWLLTAVSVGVNASANSPPAHSHNPYIVPFISPGTRTSSLVLMAIDGLLLIPIVRAVSSGPVGSPPDDADVGAGEPGAGTIDD
jgi:hypothetical protein